MAWCYRGPGCAPCGFELGQTPRDRTRSPQVPSALPGGRLDRAGAGPDEDTALPAPVRCITPPAPDKTATSQTGSGGAATFHLPARRNLLRPGVGLLSSRGGHASGRYQCWTQCGLHQRVLLETLGRVRQSLEQRQSLAKVRDGFPIGIAPQGILSGLLAIVHRPMILPPLLKVHGQFCCKVRRLPSIAASNPSPIRRCTRRHRAAGIRL